MDEATPESTSLAPLLADGELRKISSSELARRATRLNTGLDYHVQLAAAHGRAAIQHGIAIGQIFEAAAKRFEGEWANWLKTSVLDDQGGPAVSLATADRYRTLYRRRDELEPTDGSMAKCKSITDAFIKLGIVAAPEKSETKEPGEPALFRLTFTQSTVPPEKWPEAERREFLDRTAPIAEMRAKIEAMMIAA